MFNGIIIGLLDRMLDWSAKVPAPPGCSAVRGNFFVSFLLLWAKKRPSLSNYLLALSFGCSVTLLNCLATWSMWPSKSLRTSRAELPASRCYWFAMACASNLFWAC